MSKKSLASLGEKDHIILKEKQPRGPKSKRDPNKKYEKIHPDIDEATRRNLKIMMATEDKELWEVVTEAINLLAEQKGLKT